MKRNRLFGDLAGLVVAGGLFAAGPAWAGFGDIDTTFGPQVVPGYEIHDLGGDSDFGIDMVTGLNDRLYALGISCDGATCSTANKLVLTRYDKDGHLDTTFGDNGDLVVENNIGTDDFRLEVDDPEGLFYLSTIICTATQCAVAVQRRDFTNQLDPSWGNQGTASFATSTVGPGVVQLLLLPTGKLLILIEHDTRGSNNAVIARRFNVVRLNADGSVDSSWNGGSTEVSTPGGCDTGASMEIGRNPVLYVTAGKASTCAGPFQPVLRRFLADGTLDSGFGSAGELTGNFGETGDNIALVAQEQPNRQIAYGIGAFDQNQDFVIDILLLNNNGSEDTSFTPVHGSYTRDPKFIAVGNAPFQSDGKLVFNGVYQTTTTTADEGLLRLQGSALLAHPPRFTPFVRFDQVSAPVNEAAGTTGVKVDLCAFDSPVCDPFFAVQPITVPFTLGGDATRGLDYTVASNSITIPAGASSGTIPVTIIDDDVEEFNESILFTLGNVTGALPTTMNNSTILTIVDNDLAPHQVESTDNGGAVDLGLLAGLFGLLGVRRSRRR